MGNQRFSITPAKAATDPELTDSIFRTLAVIGMYGDRNGWCWPSQSTLAEIRCVSRKTINQHIKVLTDKGYLNIQPRFDEETGAQKSNMMQVRLDTEYENVTGGVTTRALQGVSPPNGYRGGEVLEVTHNAPSNDQKERNIYTESSYDLNADFITELATIAKEPLAPGFNEKKFENAAFALIGWDAELSQVAGFADYWKENGWHNNKPALTNIVNHWQDYLAGRNLQSNQSTNGTNGRNGTTNNDGSFY